MRRVVRTPDSSPAAVNYDRDQSVWLWAVFVARVGWAVLGRPRLWLAAVRLGLRMVPDRGLIPSRQYLRFRARTYGMPLVDMPAADVIRYLNWCRTFPGRVW